MTIERLSNELKRKRNIALLKDYRTAMTRVHLKPNLFLQIPTNALPKPTTLTWMPGALILLVPTCVHASLFPPVMESRAMVIIKHIKLKVREYMFIVISFYASCMHKFCAADAYSMIYIFYFILHLYLTGFAKTWLQKSLLYTFWLSLVVEHFFFFIVTFYLFNRYRIGYGR